MAPLNILAFGASQNIGYYAAVRLLEQRATVTFLLRRPTVFDDDATIQKYIKRGNVRIVAGDATKESDTRRAWEESGAVDVVLFSIGGTKATFSITKGVVLVPHDLVSSCMLNVFCTMPTHASPQLKFIIVSSSGLTPVGHAALPLVLKPLYAMIDGPHKDKICMERVVAHCAGWGWDNKKDGVPETEILPDGWTRRDGLPALGSLKQVLVVRPALLTDGKCVADELEAKGKAKRPYRVSENELGAYTVSRKDIAHFMVTALARWDEFAPKRRVNVGY
ncbi:hypothetical protein DFH06DRAFT_1376151 [Mycena polygramma]|nr:hypothetical protein DFH06DRAFT_1376151 [Mycena polygramma]